MQSKNKFPVFLWCIFSISTSTPTLCIKAQNSTSNLKIEKTIVEVTKRQSSSFEASDVKSSDVVQYANSSTLMTGLTAYYKFDESSGTAKDEAGQNYGTVSSGVTRGSTGKINNAYLFDSNTDFVTLTSTVTQKTGSYAFWIKIDAIADDLLILGNSSTYSRIFIGISNNIKIETNTNGQEFAFYTSFTTGVWHHVALVREENTVKLYRNGIITGNSTLPGSDNLTISQIGFNGRSFRGTIDELGIWSKAITATEISELYNTGTGLSFPFQSSASEAAVTSLNTLFVNSNLINLNWIDHSSNEINYIIEQSNSSGFASIQSTYTINANSIKFVVRGLSPNTTYFYRIKSINIDGKSSEYSTILTVTTTSQDNFPLVLTNGRLITKLGEPFLINGDSPWSLIVGPDRLGAEQYLENRKQKGVNALIMNLVEKFYDYHGQSKDAYGNKPFLVEGDFSTPNPAYFENVDFIIGKAREKGMEVFLFPAYLGYDDGMGHSEGWYTNVIANGPEKMYLYGKYLGIRYKDYNNIVWMMGGDCAPVEAKDEIRELVRGIQETAGDQLFSVHNARYHSGITEYTGENWIDLNTTYTDLSRTPQDLLTDFNRNYPFFYFEGRYEFDAVTAVGLRSQMYWPILSGSNGHFFGSIPLFKFEPGWNNASILESQGSQDIKRAGDFFKSRPWYNLIPDIDHTTLTSGYGNITDGSFAAAARTSNGSTVIVYIPDQRSITINMNRISGTQSHGWWYQPSSGIVYNLGLLNNNVPKAFIPPAAGDWLLVLDDATLGLKKPGQLNNTINETSLTLETSLEEYYKFDETTGQLTIDSKNGINSTLVNATQGSNGINGNAYTFNGNSNKITLPDNKNLTVNSTTNLSIAAWINFNTDNLGTWGNIFGTASIYAFQVRKITNGNYQLIWYGGSSIAASSTFSVIPGAWYHIVMTKSGNVVKFYKDNVLLTTTNSNDAGGNPNANYIGGNEGGEYFNGKIDELGIWKKSLTSTEIADLYNFGLGISYPFDPAPKSTDNKIATDLINEIDTSKYIKTESFFYPNPALNRIYFKNVNFSHLQVIICDMNGNIVFKNQLFEENSLDISNLSKGIYLIKTIDNHGIRGDKLIKE